MARQAHTPWLIATALVSLITLARSDEDNAGHDFIELAPGFEFGEFTSHRLSTDHGQILIARIDPSYWAMELHCTDGEGGAENLTAREWAERFGLAAASNAGMYHPDHRTHVGHIRGGSCVGDSITKKYQSVAAWKPRRPELAPFRIFDLDAPGVSIKSIESDYETIVQNLRLIKRPGENRWQQGSSPWVEALLAEDAAGRCLFVFSATPYSMHELNEELLGLGIDIVAAQHLDGGPIAQMFVDVGDMTRELGFYYDSGVDSPDPAPPPPIPFVIGVRPTR